MVFNNKMSELFGEKMERCKEYMEALETERKKIQVFERELPLCLELVTQGMFVHGDFHIVVCVCV